MYNQYSPYQQPQYYNPALESQINRLNQLQGYNNMQMQPNNIQMQQANPQLPQQTIRQVTSLEEVKAFTPSFDGSKTYFEDITSGNIYIKYLGMNGLPALDVYSKTEIKQNTSTNEQVEYVSKKEFEEIKNKISEYDIIFNELMGGNKNVQSNANNSNVK